MTDKIIMKRFIIFTSWSAIRVGDYIKGFGSK